MKDERSDKQPVAADKLPAYRSVTLKQLAAHLELNPATVSVVLNDVPGRSIPQATRDRIKAAARELNYQPSLLARSLRSQRTQTIGILVAGSADPNRSTIRVLAFQDQDQSCGYYPDSTATAFDKYNVRNGHYPIWGPSHFYNRVNGSVPLKPNAQTFINDLSGITPLPGVDLLALYAQNRVIPLCAMHVQRMSDGANYTPYTPSTSCNCYYDAQAIGQTSCKTCSGPTDCPASAPACNKFNNQPMGYCEPQ